MKKIAIMAVVTLCLAYGAYKGGRYSMYFELQRGIARGQIVEIGNNEIAVYVRPRPKKQLKKPATMCSRCHSEDYVG
jgi:cytochrome c553